jgi:hypothetical protein
MTAALKGLAVTFAAVAAITWLGQPADSGSAVAAKQVSAAAPRCGDAPRSRCMVHVRYAVQAADFLAVPDDVFF